MIFQFGHEKFRPGQATFLQACIWWQHSSLIWSNDFQSVFVNQKCRLLQLSLQGMRERNQHSESTPLRLYVKSLKTNDEWYKRQWELYSEHRVISNDRGKSLTVLYLVLISRVKKISSSSVQSMGKICRPSLWKGQCKILQYTDRQWVYLWKKPTVYCQHEVNSIWSEIRIPNVLGCRFANNRKL
jgi:hypothetical protein